MGMITDINIDNSGTISAVVDGSKVQLDIHVLLMKVLENVRRRLTTQYLDEVNEMNKVNNKANFYRDMMEELRKVKSIHNPVYEDDHIRDTIIEKLEAKYGKEMVEEANFKPWEYGGTVFLDTKFYNEEEWQAELAQMEGKERGYEVRTPSSLERTLHPGATVKMLRWTKYFKPEQIDTMIEDLRHRVTSMNNLNSQNQIKVKMIEQFRNETIEWQKSLLDKLDRLFQKVNQ